MLAPKVMLNRSRSTDPAGPGRFTAMRNFVAIVADIGQGAPIKLNL
jgi:hypothetical protein